MEFTDWIAPNTTLAAGDIDVNYFQHIPFLENANAAAGSDLVPFKPGIINNIGLYAKKYKSLDELPVGATVAIANDPINSGRGLQLLAKAGLITLKPGVGYKATEDDIIANPKKSRFCKSKRCNWFGPTTMPIWCRVTRLTSAWPKRLMQALRCCSTGSITPNT